MCLILDANCMDFFLQDPVHEDMEPIERWLKTRNGKLVYSNHPQIEREMSHKMKERLVVYRQKGQAKFYSASDVKREENELSGLKSDDSHIIALAIVAQARLLASHDTDLHTDYKNIPREKMPVRGKVYQNKRHARLLTRDTCP